MAAPTSSGVHTLGGGLHDLPVRIVSGGRVERLTSRECILLLFVYWAQRQGWDAVEIHRRACPGQPALRPDHLLFCRQWVEIPGHIGTDLLLRDLSAIGLGDLAAVIDGIRCGRWSPPEAFSHWVVTADGRIAGEARALDPPDRPDELGQHFCYVRLFAMPEMAEWGYTAVDHLRQKSWD